MLDSLKQCSLVVLYLFALNPLLSSLLDFLGLIVSVVASTLRMLQSFVVRSADGNSSETLAISKLYS